MKINTKLVEGLVLVVFFTLFLFLALGSQWDQRLKHDFPYGYGASDAFFHQSVAEYMNDVGRVKYTPSYEVGGHENVYDAHPPMLFELSALVSRFSGIEVFDSIMLVSAIMWVFSGIIIYIIIRRFNRSIALLSLPIMILTLTGNYKIALYWGYWLFITGVFFLLAVFWAIGRMELKKIWILLGILLGAIGISHIPEAFFLVVFLGLYFVYDLVKKKKLNKRLVKIIIYSGIISLVISAFSINIFFGSFAKTEGYRQKFDTELGNASVYLKDIGIIGVLILVGVVLFLVLKKKDLAGWIGIFMFIVSYLTFLGLGKRAATHRWFWYFYLAFFFGLAVYQLIKFFYKKFKVTHAAVVSFVLIIVFAYPLLGVSYGSGVMDPYNWRGIQWIADNTPEEARVYYFYADALSHNAALYNTKHLAFNVARSDLVDAIQNKEIRRKYNPKYNKQAFFDKNNLKSYNTD